MKGLSCNTSSFCKAFHVFFSGILLLPLFILAGWSQHFFQMTDKNLNWNWLPPKKHTENCSFCINKSDWTFQHEVNFCDFFSNKNWRFFILTPCINYLSLPLVQTFTVNMILYCIYFSTFCLWPHAHGNLFFGLFYSIVMFYFTITLLYNVVIFFIINADFQGH